ncbi:hypothetical protein L873DRAFT_1840230 [Choiromyces venosus 120613-1]|uniref:Uncharacterized protein n=1 Tax=Choiromyces venosus 120613-1 TaxID=1336337 RepID=A0A3N4KA48_9PEZI|nr:hypothetical protein L873DRAFT_1840230 [Choiromyces venosus 120613-1]
MSGNPQESADQFFVRNACVLFAVGATAAILRIGIGIHLSRRVMLDEMIMFFSLLCWAVDTTCMVTVQKGTNQMTDELRATISDADTKQRQIGSKDFISACISLVCRPLSGNWRVRPDPGCKLTTLLHKLFRAKINHISEMHKWLLLRVNCWYPQHPDQFPASSHPASNSPEITGFVRAQALIETCCGMIVANAPGIKTIFTRRKPAHSSGGVSGSYELSQTGQHSTSKRMSKNGTVITTANGESTERIVDPENPPMVIQMDVSYEVVSEQRPSPDRSKFQEVGGPKYTVGVGSSPLSQSVVSTMLRNGP